MTAFVETRDAARASIARQTAERATRPWMLSRPRSAYAGTYVGPTLGTIRVTERAGDLVVTSGVMEAVAEPFTRPESIRVELAPLQGQVILFAAEGETPGSLVFLGETFTRR